MLPLIISGNNDSSIVLNLLDKFDLAYLKDSYPSSISYGEAQRVAVLRSVVNIQINLLDKYNQRGN